MCGSFDAVGYPSDGVDSVRTVCVWLISRCEIGFETDRRVGLEC